MAQQQLAVIPAEEFFQRLERMEEKILAILSAKEAPDPGLSELFSRKQAAEFLGVSLGTIDNLARAGLLQKHYLGSIPKFKREELLQAFEGWKKFQRN
jgi:excisionase family DNA binding protein